MPKRTTTHVRTSTDMYRFHRPSVPLHNTPHPLTRDSRTCVKNLLAYHMRQPPPPYPRTMCAAVLVALFVGRMGNLYVLLSRRASTLRSYAGDTALPGGKVDPEDESIEETARREALEEIGLPRDKLRIPLLCVLDPFLAGNNILVTPVVVLIMDNTLRPILNTPEVASLFSHPLASFLADSAPFVSSNPDPEQDSAAPEQEPDAHAELVAAELPYHTHSDISWPQRSRGEVHEQLDDHERAFRMHRFLTGREAGGIKPVFGLTAAILIRTAMIGYARKPAFTLHAPHEPDMRWHLHSVFKDDCSLNSHGRVH
ncbi:unnamed protein product [Peniophora sp. CBMAI 1063]|nr:unnamed protein product [Peniophora sp. CBMAI 1063]